MKNYPYNACVKTKSNFIKIYNSDTISCFVFLVAPLHKSHQFIIMTIL